MSKAQITYVQPDAIIPYCGTCRAEKTIERDTPIPRKYIGKRVKCPDEDARSRHWAKLISGPVQRFWLEREADFVRYETTRGWHFFTSPMRWVTWTDGKAGIYVTFRFLFLVLALASTAWMPEMLDGFGTTLG
jgi:hypothetical protein